MASTTGTRPVGAVAAGGRPPASLPRRLLRPVVIYAASRLVLVFPALLAAGLRPDLGLRGALTVWDGAWYLRIITDGYAAELPPPGLTGDPAQTNIAFFPLFPVLAQVLDPVVPSGAATAAVATAMLFGGVATVMVWLLAAEFMEDDKADRAAALFAFFPGAFVFTFAYSEGVMLAFAAACLWALVRRQWVLAGVMGALATAARPSAVVLVAACGWAALVEIRRAGTWRALAAPAITPVGMVAYFGYLWALTGEPLAWLLVQRAGWGERTDFGEQNLREVGILLSNPLSPATHQLVILLGLVYIAVVTVPAIRSRLPGALWIWSYGTLAMVVLSSALGPRPRFLLAAFPLLLPLAMRLRHSTYTALLGASAALMGTLLVLYSGGSTISGPP